MIYNVRKSGVFSYEEFAKTRADSVVYDDDSFSSTPERARKRQGENWLISKVKPTRAIQRVKYTKVIQQREKTLRLATPIEMTTDNDSSSNEKLSTTPAYSRATSIIIENLSKEVTATYLIMKVFDGDGEIISAIVHTDDKGESLGTAELIFAEEGKAVSALRRHQREIVLGKAIKMRLCNKMNPSKATAERVNKSNESPMHTHFSTKRKSFPKKTISHCSETYGRLEKRFQRLEETQSKIRLTQREDTRSRAHQSKTRETQSITRRNERYDKSPRRHSLSSVILKNKHRDRHRSSSQSSQSESSSSSSSSSNTSDGNSNSDYSDYSDYSDNYGDKYRDNHRKTHTRETQRKNNRKNGRSSNRTKNNDSESEKDEYDLEYGFGPGSKGNSEFKLVTITNKKNIQLLDKDDSSSTPNKRLKVTKRSEIPKNEDRIRLENRVGRVGRVGRRARGGRGRRGGRTERGRSTQVWSTAPTILENYNQLSPSSRLSYFSSDDDGPVARRRKKNKTKHFSLQKKDQPQHFKVAI